jgi:hypothetical protein
MNLFSIKTTTLALVLTSTCVTGQRLEAKDFEFQANCPTAEQVQVLLSKEAFDPKKINATTGEFLATLPKDQKIITTSQMHGNDEVTISWWATSLETNKFAGAMFPITTTRLRTSLSKYTPEEQYCIYDLGYTVAPGKSNAQAKITFTRHKDDV